MAINVLEKRAFVGAVSFVVISLALVAFATWGLGINVANCIPLGTKPYQSSSVTKHDGNFYEVHYVARMWAFEPHVLKVPTGSTLDISAITKDVTHGLEIAGTNLNLMVVPGAIASGRVKFSKPGVYTVVCHEFCGKGHQSMGARIEVVDGLLDAFVEAPPVDPGQKLLDAKGCLACHSIDGTAALGPTFKNAWGQPVHLADGTTRILDENFFAAKVLHPTDLATDGFPPVMPEVKVTPDELQRMEQYLKELKN